MIKTFRKKKLTLEKLAFVKKVPMTVQFPATFSCGTANVIVNFMLMGCTVRKMQGTTVCTAVDNLMEAKLFAPGQGYVVLKSRKVGKRIVFGRAGLCKTHKLKHCQHRRIKEDGNIASNDIL
jgi:hypothetical protein